MVTSFNLVYSAAAAFRILKKQLGDILVKVESIKVIGKIIQVTYRTVFGRCSTFISMKTFKNHFPEWRREQSKKLLSNKVSKSEYIVLNPQKESRYYVDVKGSHIFCGCEDFRNQMAFLGKGACKHIYCVLRDYFRCNSLLDFIQHREWEIESQEHPEIETQDRGSVARVLEHIRSI